MKSGSYFAFATFIALINVRVKVKVKVRVKLGLGFRIEYIYFFTKTIVTEAPFMLVKPKFLRLCNNKTKGGLGHCPSWLNPVRADM